MTIEIWLAYVGTVLVLMSTPGPSQILMLSTSMESGFPRSMWTAFGDLTANLGQMLLAGAGLTALLAQHVEWITLIKWAGVLYLAYLGVKLLCQGDAMVTGGTRIQPRSVRALWLRGFLTSAANPKAIVFFTALFPQFIDPVSDLSTQIATLSLTYLALDSVFLSAYGAGSAGISRLLSSKGTTWFSRAAGVGVLVTAALLAQRPVVF